MRRNLLFGIAALVLLLASCGPSVDSPASDPGERIRRVENGLLLTDTIAERMAYHKVPGVSIAVVNDFELEWAKGYGVLEFGGAAPVTPETLFQAGSVAKPVTAVGALHYVEQGLLDLDESVNDRLVSWQVPENQFTAQAEVTLRRLLSHTAGVNQGLNLGYAPGEEVPTLLQALDGQPPANSLPVRVDRVPGTEEHYSNGGYLVVVQLLQDLLGKPFTEVMDEAVFEPTGMTSSTFAQELPADLEARAATPHGWDVEAWQESPGLVCETHVHDPGYGGLWTTAPDLARFGAEIMRAYAGESEAVLSQDMVERMLVPVAQVPMQEPFETYQGLGFVLLDLGQERWLIHFGGSWPGYISVLLAQPERGLAVAIMTNSWSGDELIWEILYSIFYAYGILPTTGQVLGVGYSLLLFLAAFLFWPVGYVLRSIRTRKLEGEGSGRRQGKVATTALIVAMLSVIAILVLSLLYRGPLGGALVNSLDRGETILTKALLGIFFSTPVALLGLTLVVWKNRYWSVRERVQYTIIVMGALFGVFLLRDLWGLMFWG